MKPFNLVIGTLGLIMVAGFFFSRDLFRPTATPLATPAIPANSPDSDQELALVELSRYVDYSQSHLDQVKAATTPVLFFAATTWCQTCEALEQEILSRYEDIPQDITILKVDYDNDKAMNQKHRVTAQHTLVVLDENGLETDRWIGGGLDLLLQKLNKS